MKNLCFVLTVSSGINYGSISSVPLIKNNEDLKEYFSDDYTVSTNYIKDKDKVDYLVVPDPFVPFENDLPIIKVPARLFMTKDF
ncbi:MAG: hypothetical protein RSB63_02330, partial [Enterococcus sp.]